MTLNLLICFPLSVKGLRLGMRIEGMISCGALSTCSSSDSTAWLLTSFDVDPDSDLGLPGIEGLRLAGSEGVRKPADKSLFEVWCFSVSAVHGLIVDRLWLVGRLLSGTRVVSCTVVVVVDGRRASSDSDARKNVVG